MSKRLKDAVCWPYPTTNHVIATVLLAGVTVTTFLTLCLVPVAYSLFAQYTGSPGDVARKLSLEANQLGEPAE